MCARRFLHVKPPAGPLAKIVVVRGSKLDVSFHELFYSTLTGISEDPADSLHARPFDLDSAADLGHGDLCRTADLRRDQGAFHQRGPAKNPHFGLCSSAG
jgi:hypothetical protein